MGTPFDELPRLAVSGLRHSWDERGPGDSLGTLSHVVYPMGGIGWDDWLDGFYLQSSSQWDSLRHIQGPDGFYGGWRGDPAEDPGPLGIQHWAGPGIIGRGVLIDLAALAAACHADGRYDFLFTSVPLNVTGGVGSPANAVAVR